ncbi:MAG: argininosuccinate lyase [Nitrospirota bacterium]
MIEKPWGGRFKGKTSRLVEDFTESISFDKRLWRYDIKGSIAHARMLAREGIINRDESKNIINGLREIEKEIEDGRFVFRPELEDIHMNIESALIEKIGEAGGKLHTARSRNDQIALDLRLYLRDEINEVLLLIKKLQRVIVTLAERNIDVIMPGYTHLQRAQPVLFPHHLLAHIEALNRDIERFEDCLKRLNLSPLGASSIAGTTFPIDRVSIAKELRFSGVTENSIDSVSDRDFAIEFCGVASVLMMHLSRLSEELVLWSSSEFDFIEIPDAFTTGSSIMPQKKNPDVAELVRGKTGRVYGNLITLLTVMKGLPLSYNRDMQEDKEAIFDTVDTVKESLKVYAEMFKGIKIKDKNMYNAAIGGFTTATDLADYLVKKGMPFRKAHTLVGRIVKYCLDKGKTLAGMSIKEFRAFSEIIDSDVFSCLSVEKAVNDRLSYGGTAKRNVLRRIKRLKGRL